MLSYMFYLDAPAGFSYLYLFGVVCGLFVRRGDVVHLHGIRKIVNRRVRKTVELVQHLEVGRPRGVSSSVGSPEDTVAWRVGGGGYGEGRSLEQLYMQRKSMPGRGGADAMSRPKRTRRTKQKKVSNLSPTMDEQLGNAYGDFMASQLPLGFIPGR